MMDVLLVMMFQAAAGAPQATPPTTPAGQSAASDTGQTSTQQSNAQSQDAGIRCRREATTGSLMGQRHCTTREQRERRQHENDRAVNQLQRATDVVQPSGSPFGSPSGH